MSCCHLSSHPFFQPFLVVLYFEIITIVVLWLTKHPDWMMITILTHNKRQAEMTTYERPNRWRTDKSFTSTWNVIALLLLGCTLLETYDSEKNHAVVQSKLINNASRKMNSIVFDLVARSKFISQIHNSHPDSSPPLG